VDEKPPVKPSAEAIAERQAAVDEREADVGRLREVRPPGARMGATGKCTPVAAWAACAADLRRRRRLELPGTRPPPRGGLCVAGLAAPRPSRGRARAAQEEAADPKAKGLAKKAKNAEVALQHARDELAKLMELCGPGPPRRSRVSRRRPASAPAPARGPGKCMRRVLASARGNAALGGRAPRCMRLPASARALP
jgi:hypothetical protein